MDSSFKKTLVETVICGSLFLLCIGGGVGCFVYAHNLSSTLNTYTYSFTPEEQSSGDDLILSLNILDDKKWMNDDTKKSHPDNPYEAQCDFKLTNNLDKTFHNWTISIELSSSFVIDRYWNGDYQIDGNTLTFTPDKEAYNTLSVSSGASGTFGAIIYSSDDYEHMISATLKGYTVYSGFDFPVIWAFMSVGVLSLFALILSLALYMHSRRYIEQEKKYKSIILQSIQTFVNFIDAKDPYTQGHSRRVACYACEIGRRMGLSDKELEDLNYEALMHDCGKVSIPDSVLNKQGKLTDDEFNQIKMHTVKGGEMLKDFSSLPNIRDGALCHHERYDGKGYPIWIKR